MDTTLLPAFSRWVALGELLAVMMDLKYKTLEQMVMATAVAQAVMAVVQAVLAVVQAVLAVVQAVIGVQIVLACAVIAAVLLQMREVEELEKSRRGGRGKASVPLTTPQQLYLTAFFRCFTCSFYREGMRW
jgi:hypothetical protein